MAVQKPYKCRATFRGFDKCLLESERI